MRFVKFFMYFMAAISASAAAMADTVFLVQLGSYESQEQADNAWSRLTNENPKLLNGLSHQNSRISLPPDNKESFRLQAGPISQRDDAKSICSSLLAEEEECFVVETAMFVGDETPTQLAQAETPAEPAEIKAAATSSNAAAADSSLFQQAGNVLDDIGDALMSPFTSDAPETAATTAAVTAPELTQAAEDIVEKVDIVTTPAAPVSTVAVEEEVEEAIVTPEIQLPALQEKGVEEMIASASEVAAERKAATAEIEAVETAPAEEEKPAEIAEKTSASSFLPWLTGRKTERVTATVLPIEAVQPPAALAAMPVIEKPDVEIQAVDTKATEVAPVESAIPHIARNAMRSEVIMQQLPGVHMAQRNPADFPVKGAAEGSVEVAEAIPVPLSDLTGGEDSGVALKQPKNVGLPVFTGRKALGWNGSPSQNFLQRTAWVKLSYFENEAAAMSYWNELRRTQPAMTKDLRMRITKPYLQRGMMQRVSMQLGPFLEYKDVQEACKLAGKPPLVCEVQRDTGISAADAERGSDGGYVDYSSRSDISRNNQATGRSNQFWVQLGSYRNRGDAMRMWDELSHRHSELKGHFPHLASPVNSSADRAVYRLRTGPFASRAAADQLCGSLKSASTPCISVSE